VTIQDDFKRLKRTIEEHALMLNFLRRLLSPEAHGLWLADTREGREIQDEARRLLNGEGK
jgi:hypothetical protein